MSLEYNKKLVPIAKTLRKNMTPEEKKLWYQFLKKLPVTVNRQKNIGNYIVDFYIHKTLTVIEIDGAQHETLEHEKQDNQRDNDLKKLGITVLRYPNWAVNKDFNMVCNDILGKLGINADEIEQ